MSKADTKSAPGRHIVLRLGKGWQYEGTTGRFKKGKEPPFAPKDLPKRTRIVLQVPALATKKDRSKAEDELARGIQVVPPEDTSSDELLEKIRKWPCVEKAWIAPTPVPSAAPGKGSRIGAAPAIGATPGKPAGLGNPSKRTR